MNKIGIKPHFLRQLLLILLLLVMVFWNCETDKTALNPLPEGPAPQITIEAVNIDVIEVQLKIAVSNLDGKKQIAVLRDSTEVYNFYLSGNDTLVIDTGLISEQNYTYQSILYFNGTIADTSTNLNVQTQPVWQSLGFEDKLAVRLKIAKPYLYACAAAKGLWRKNIETNSDWEYLGLADSSLGNYANVGVQDVDILGDDLMVAYSHFFPIPWETFGVWRSTDGGLSWFRSDSGMPDSTRPYNTIERIERSPHIPEYIVTYEGIGGSFRSTNRGEFWELMWGERLGPDIRDYLKWQPNRAGWLWYYGETHIFTPFLFWSTDYGESVAGNLNFNEIGVPMDNAVYDIAFDAVDPNIIYLGMLGAVIKSVDNGNSWIVPLFTDPQGYLFRTLCAHPFIPNRIFFAAYYQLYFSTNGGQNQIILSTPFENKNILSLVFNEEKKRLYIATSAGIYSFRDQIIN